MMRRLALCVLSACAAPAALDAQADPRLVAIVRQAQDGQGDSARAELGKLLAATPPSDSLYAELLFVGAITAATAQEMQRNLQRITVEHALSPWADDALLKLAQLEYASGNLPGSARSLERLRGDFPASPLTGLAAFWAARTYFDMREQESACEWLGLGLARARPDDTEVRGQLQFFSQRCPPALLGTPPRDTIRLAAAVDTPRVAPPVEAPPVEAPPVEAPPVEAPPPVVVQPVRPAAFRVQVVAASTQAMADDALRRLRAMDLEGVVVREGGLMKVRAGAYATRAAARAALPRIRAEFPGAFLVSGQ